MKRERHHDPKADLEETEAGHRFREVGPGRATEVGRPKWGAPAPAMGHFTRDQMARDEPRQTPEGRSGHGTGLPAGTAIRSVPLDEIDHEDGRFQFRLGATVGDLRKSLLADGQQVPVVLWGKAPPYKIVDGFRRVEALRQIGQAHVAAVIRDDLDEAQAFTLAFLENAKRKNLSSWDKASAIWQAVHLRKMKTEQAAEDFGLSRRQVERYLQLMALSEDLKAVVRGRRITMAHAVVLHRCRVKDPKAWIAKIEADAGLSARRLRRTLTASGKCGRHREYIKTDRHGFRLSPIRFTRDLDEAERRRVREALEKALQVVNSVK